MWSNCSIWNDKKNTDKIYKTMVFKTLDIRQYRTMIPEKSPTNELSSIITSAYCILSFQAAASEGHRAEPSTWTELQRQGRKFQETEGLELTWLSTEEKCADKTPVTRRRSSLSFRHSTGQHITTGGSGKNHLVPSTHRKLEMPISTCQSEKPRNWLALGTTVRRALTE